MLKQQAANQHRKKGLSRIYIAFFWAHKCPAGFEEMRRTTTFHRAKIHHILPQLSLLAVLHVLPLSKYLQAQKMRKIAPNYKWYGKNNSLIKFQH